MCAHHGNNCKSIDNFKETGKRGCADDDDDNDDDDVDVEEERKEEENIENWWSSVNICNLYIQLGVS